MRQLFEAAVSWSYDGPAKGGDSWEGEGTTPVGPEVALKSITFTVPKTTPAGTYRIHGGYLDVTHRSGGYEWLDVYAKFYQMEISDLTITCLLYTSRCV